jgi:cobalt-precorrin 5A hydrolase / precorrin-3B C17-methyltransferase
MSRIFWVGLGCRRGTSAALIRYAFDAICSSCKIEFAEIAGIATLERKSDEAGLIEFNRGQRWPVCLLTAADLKNCSVPTPSSKIQSAVGTASVAEAAALTAAKNDGGAHAITQLVALKRSFCLAQEPGAVTLAIAQVLSFQYRERHLPHNLAFNTKQDTQHNIKLNHR